MPSELQPLDTERYVEKLSRIIEKLGDIATRASGLDAEVKKLKLEAKVALDILWCATCPDREEALSDEDAASELVVQNCVEEIESLTENREY